MLYAIAVLAALLGGACWRLIVLRRALVRERVVARLDQAASHRELCGMRHAVRTAHQETARGEDVLAVAAAIVDAALAGNRTPNRPGGGTDA